MTIIVLDNFGIPDNSIKTWPISINELLTESALPGTLVRNLFVSGQE
jgi:hypothetical protein